MARSLNQGYYNVPGMMDGNICLLHSDLACVAPKIGRAKWKSRSPGDELLIGVDGHLILSTHDGKMHVVKANQEGYHEIASTRVLEKLF